MLMGENGRFMASIWWNYADSWELWIQLTGNIRTIGWDYGDSWVELGIQLGGITESWVEL